MNSGTWLTLILRVIVFLALLTGVAGLVMAVLQLGG